MKTSYITVLFVLIIAGYLTYASMHNNSNNNNYSNNNTNQPTNTSAIGQRSKSVGCQANGALQDISCTPGAIDSSLTTDVICSPSFTTKSVRNVPSEEKRQVYEEYGITTHHAGEYEVDHLISLELGGSNDIANLWPEAAEPRPGFHEKDMIENYLHKQVCNGGISLQIAQQQIANNWLQIYNNIPTIKP